jgi:hypothetical protein
MVQNWVVHQDRKKNSNHLTASKLNSELKADKSSADDTL